MSLERSENKASASGSEQEIRKLTRKQRRELQREQERDHSNSPTAPRQTHNDTNHSSLEYSPPLPTPATQILKMATPVRLLVCSIGNPGSFMNTLHSAGHTVLNTLAHSLSYPSFQKSRAHGNGLVSRGADYTLWQSTSLMNISGAGVAAAWRQFQKEGQGEQAKLVVVHDELELAIGMVKVKQGYASPKGHNGLKSINGLIKGADYTRIGVGIGRPESRDPNVVAGYVLRKMSAQERVKIEGTIGIVEMELRRMKG